MMKRYQVLDLHLCTWLERRVGRDQVLYLVAMNKTLGTGLWCALVLVAPVCARGTASV
jgi:hypothetical protein